MTYKIAENARHQAISPPNPSPPAAFMKLLWTTSAALAIVIGSYLAYDAYEDRKSITETERKHLLSLANVVDRNLGEQLRTSAAMLDGLREHATVLRPEEASATAVDQMRRHLVNGIATTTGVQSLWVVEPDGRLRASSQPDGFDELMEIPEFAQTLQAARDPKLLYLSPPFASAAGPFTVAMVKGGGAVRGAPQSAAIALLEPAYFVTLLQPMVDSPDMRLAVAHGAGKVLFSTQTSPDARGKDLSAVPESLFNRHLQSGRATSFEIDRVVAASGDRRLIAIQSVWPAGGRANQPLVVSVHRSAAAVYQDWVSQT